ncbi:hypothetical protein AB4Y32_17895 [Paraburkholderia phymatum]|uniref:Uncharacterized protein n=1 Tax=Paraburkholderia phymatum TaxID=148447 RepID=A0ACC6U208_9BURK
MLFRWNLRHGIARKGAASAALMVAVALSACGGGSSGNPSSDSNASGASSSAPSATPSTNASFFDGVFMDGSGAGYYEFGANMPPAGGLHPTGTGRIRYYVKGDTDSNFSVSSETILGTYAADVDTGYITAEGLFMSRNPNFGDIGSNSRIFQRLSQGYQLGMNGMSAPLYEITLTVQDVSGQPVNKVVGIDEAGGNALSFLLGNDTTPMPAGAQTYRQTAKVLVPHLMFELSGNNTGFASLEQAQARVGGTIQTLGGYRYLSRNGTAGAYIEYNGAVYFATVYGAGDIRDAMPQGYNRLAADLLATDEQKTGL